jgi:hypothetical protein
MFKNIDEYLYELKRECARYLGSKSFAAID